VIARAAQIARATPLPTPLPTPLLTPLLRRPTPLLTPLLGPYEGRPSLGIHVATTGPSNFARASWLGAEGALHTSTLSGASCAPCVRRYTLWAQLRDPADCVCLNLCSHESRALTSVDAGVVTWLAGVE